MTWNFGAGPDGRAQPAPAAPADTMTLAQATQAVDHAIGALQQARVRATDDQKDVIDDKLASLADTKEKLLQQAQRGQAFDEQDIADSTAAAQIAKLRKRAGLAR
jgi:small-conductance mechanosensitive channel